MTARLSFMAIIAHPDDESFGVGGTLAKYAREGVEVSLVVATSGEAGAISDPSLANSENLGQVRRQELQCAVDILGVKHLRLLDYRDGHLAEADPREAERKIVAIMRELRPQVVVTFDPHGVYGHPDHVAIHRLTVAACQSSGDPNKHPEHLDSLRAHAPDKLYFRAIPADMMRLMADRIQATRAGLGLDPIDVIALATPEELVTTVVDVSEYADVKLQAIQCHRTQISGDIATSWPDSLLQHFLSREYFSLASWRRRSGEALETDLFAGLR